MSKKKKVIIFLASIFAISLIGAISYAGYKKVGEPMQKREKYDTLKEQYDNSEITINNSDSSSSIDASTSLESSSENADDTTSNNKESSSKVKTEANQNAANNYTSYNGGYTYEETESHIIGWITVPGTGIDYPVLYRQGDNTYYLTHDYLDRYDSYGSIYLDGSGYVGSKNMTLFGHNMNVYYNSMFHNLLKFESKDFFNSHDTLYFDYGGNSNEWEIIGCAIVNLDDEPISYNRCDFSDDEDFIKFSKELLKSCKNKRDVEITANDRLLTLSTCSYHYKNCRTVIVCCQTVN